MNLPESEKAESRLAAADREIEVMDFSADQWQVRQDQVAVEEPVEIRVICGPLEKRVMRSVSITMRTPGNDEELAAGFLLTEGILTSPDQIADIQLRGVDPDGVVTGNIVRVEVRPEVDLDLNRLQRNFFTTSSCGVCGKASLEALRVQGLKPVGVGDFEMDAARICELPDRLRASQNTFRRTGGLHGAGLFAMNGHLLDTREDVGRHNAVDKLIGRYFLDGETPMSNYGMIVSGRVSFEIMQKGLVAGIPVIVAVGAPSSLAVEMAIEYQMTLIGFASQSRFNIYATRGRVKRDRMVE